MAKSASVMHILKWESFLVRALHFLPNTDLNQHLEPNTRIMPGVENITKNLRIFWNPKPLRMLDNPKGQRLTQRILPDFVEEFLVHIVNNTSKYVECDSP